MRDDDLAERMYSSAELTPVQAIMTGLFGLSLAVTLGFAIGGAIGVFSF